MPEEPYNIRVDFRNDGFDYIPNKEREDAASVIVNMAMAKLKQDIQKRGGYVEIVYGVFRSGKDTVAGVAYSPDLLLRERMQTVIDNYLIKRL